MNTTSSASVNGNICQKNKDLEAETTLGNINICQKNTVLEAEAILGKNMAYMKEIS